MNLRTSLDSKVAFLLCLIHITGIDSFRTLSQSSKISLTNTNGQSSDLVFMCAMKAINEDRGYKVNMETGECKAGDSSSPAPGFTYLDKTDMFQHFINEVGSFSSVYMNKVYSIGIDYHDL